MNRGFTLIEMLVALVIFSFVALLSVGSLLILTSSERRIATIQTSQDNVRFGIEAAAREIRTGINYQNSTTCAGASDCFEFLNADGNIVVYRRSTNQVDCDSRQPAGQGCITRAVRMLPSDPLIYHSITGPDVSVDGLLFILHGGIPTDTLQPRVTIVVNAVAGKATKNETEIFVQTSVSQLRLDIGA